MTQVFHRFPSELEDALYASTVAPEGLTAAALDALVRAYPAHAQDLTDIAVELAIDALGNDENIVTVEESTSLAVSRAMSNFNNRLHEVSTIRIRLEKKSAFTSETPFTKLDRSEIQSLAKKLRANTLFVIKLRDHIIDPSTITPGFRKVLSDSMSVSLDSIAMHFTIPPSVAAHAHYKADQKPAAVRLQTFEEAVQTSNLTAEQQEYLLSL